MSSPRGLPLALSDTVNLRERWGPAQLSAPNLGGAPERKRSLLVLKTASNQSMHHSRRGKELTFSNSATTHSPRTEYMVYSMGSAKWFLSHCSLLEHSPSTAITHPPRETASEKQQRVRIHRISQGHTNAHICTQRNSHANTQVNTPWHISINLKHPFTERHVHRNKTSIHSSAHGHVNAEIQT